MLQTFKDEKMNKVGYAIGITTLLALVSGCASQPPRIAQNKMYMAHHQKLDFGGRYDVEENKLSISVNGDVIMRGSFPPFTPTKSMNGTYDGMTIGADCYFGTILSGQGGLVGVIAGAVQDSHGKSGDQCKITVDKNQAATLYF